MDVCWCYVQAELPICPLRLVLLRTALRLLGVSVDKMRSSDIGEISTLSNVCQWWRSAFDSQLQQRLAFLLQCQFRIDFASRFYCIFKYVT